MGYEQREIHAMDEGEAIRKMFAFSSLINEVITGLFSGTSDGSATPDSMTDTVSPYESTRNTNIG